jgi:type IV fimbrial biogenesis protein FimT
MNISRNRGFTLWELLVTLLVAGILLGIGVPSFIEFQRNNAIVAAANDLVAAVLTARAEAVKRQVPVTLCASVNPTAANPVCSPTGAGANGGYIVWIDENGNVDANGTPVLTDATDGNAVVDAGETVVLARAEPGGTLNVFGDSGYVAYGPNGFRRNVAGLGASATTVLYCDERGNRTAAGDVSSARVVRIDRTGRGQVLREVAEVTPVVAALGAACP